MHGKNLKGCHGHHHELCVIKDRQISLLAQATRGTCGVSVPDRLERMPDEFGQIANDLVAHERCDCAWLGRFEVVSRLADYQTTIHRNGARSTPTPSCTQISGEFVLPRRLEVSLRSLSPGTLTHGPPPLPEAGSLFINYASIEVRDVIVI